MCHFPFLLLVTFWLLFQGLPHVGFISEHSSFVVSIVLPRIEVSKSELGRSSGTPCFSLSFSDREPEMWVEIEDSWSWNSWSVCDQPFQVRACLWRLAVKGSNPLNTWGASLQEVGRKCQTSCHRGSLCGYCCFSGLGERVQQGGVGSSLWPGTYLERWVKGPWFSRSHPRSTTRPASEGTIWAVGAVSSPSL